MSAEALARRARFSDVRFWLLRRLNDCSVLARVLVRRWYLCLPLAFAYGWAMEHLRLNVSHSLPYTLVYVEHNPSKLKVGDLVIYRFTGRDATRFAEIKEAPFFKRLAGMAGDRVSVAEREVFVNGQPMGVAKRRSWDGRPLTVLPAGQIPPGFWYVRGDSPDSFDSRYAESGLVHARQISDRVHVLF